MDQIPSEDDSVMMLMTRPKCLYGAASAGYSVTPPSVLSTGTGGDKPLQWRERGKTLTDLF